MRRSPTHAAIFALLLVVASSCTTPLEERLPPPPGAAVLTGVVRLVDGAMPPAYAREQLGWGRLLDGDLGDTGCPPRERENVLSLAPDRGLAGVVVAASAFTGKHLYEKRTHEVVFEDCRLSPTIVAATGGDILEVVNRGKGDVPVTFGPVPEPIALRPGLRPRIALIPGVESLMCPPEVGCGRTDVVVFHHSVHAVTDATGRFRIDGFPTRQNVAVHAWHPLLREAVTQVWLEPGETREVGLVIHPKPILPESSSE